MRRCRRDNMAIYASRVTDEDKEVPRRLGGAARARHARHQLPRRRGRHHEHRGVRRQGRRGLHSLHHPPHPLAHRRLLQPAGAAHPRDAAALRARCRVRGRHRAPRPRARLPPAARRRPRARARPHGARRPGDPGARGRRRHRAARGRRARSSRSTPGTGDLHMRYTARTRSVAWKDDAATRGGGGAPARRSWTATRACVLRTRLAAGHGARLQQRPARAERLRGRPGRRPRLLYRARYVRAHRRHRARLAGNETAGCRRPPRRCGAARTTSACPRRCRASSGTSRSSRCRPCPARRR